MLRHHEIASNSIVRLPITDDITIPRSKEEKLSEIIRKIKERKELRKGARNNFEKDFSFYYYDHIDDALI